MAGEGSRKFIRSKGFRWSAIGIGAFLVVFALVGFFLVPVLAKNKIEELLGAELQRKVTVERIEVNPFVPNARLIGLSVANLTGAQPMLGFGRLELDLSWRSLIELAPVVRGVRLIDPVVQLARDAQGRLSVQDLLDKWAAKPKSDEPTPKFSVANIELHNGRVAFDDQQAKVQHKVEAIEVKLPFLSSLPVHQDVHIHPNLSALVNGTKFAFEGRAKPFSTTHESALLIDLASFDIRPYLAYVPGGLPVTVASANLAIKGQVEFSQPPQGRPTVNIAGQARLNEVDLREKGGEPLVKLAALTVDARSLAPLEGRYTLSKVSIESPQVTVHRRTGQTAFFEAVLPTQPAPREANKDSGKEANKGEANAAGKTANPLVWLVEEIAVKDGRLDFADALFQPKALAVQADALQVVVKGLSNQPDVAATYELAGHGSTGEQLATQGEIKLAPIAAKGRFDVRGIGLKTWWWVAEPHVALDATDGELGLAGQFDLAMPAAGPAIRLESVAAQLRNLVLRQRWDKVEFAKVPALDIGGTSVDLGTRKVVITSVDSSGGRIGLVRDREGGLNVAKLSAPAPAAPRQTAATRKEVPATGAAAAPATGAAAAPAWSVELKKLLLERYAVELKDLQAGKTADLKLDGMRVLVENVSTEKSAGPAPKGRLELSTRFNQQGSLQASGPLSIAPLATTLKVDAKNLVIVPLQPYFTEYVNALVASGAITAKGEVGLRVPEQGPVQATFKGDVLLADFAAVTKTANEDLLKWKSLSVGGINLVAQPFKLDVGEVALTDFFSRLIISPEGRLNLQDVMVKHDATGAPVPVQVAAGAGTSARAPSRAASPPAAASAPAAANNSFSSPDLQTTAPPPTRAVTTIVPGQDAPSGPVDIRVGKISLVNGNIDFSDFFIKPNYRANLTGMTGGISGLSPEAPGDLELRGKVDNAGSVEILGKVNPLARSLFLDLQANATDIDLPRLSPYSVKYVGYGIEKGKLSMKVKYTIDDRKLTAENNIVLDQLTFGEKIEGPDAIKLPVLFAVALLKDRNGVIDVNLPISGSLDDPQFSVAGIVIRIIVNLIVKAVTAPFSLLAGLAGGGGAELSYLDFAPGRVALEPDTDKKLQTLAKALTDRPGLKLDLAGRVDREADRQALVRRAVEQQVKAAKVKETVKTGAAASAIDDVVIAPQEYEKFLKIAFAASAVPKPKLASGAPKELKVEEIEQLMMADAQIGDSDLRQLANERAQRAKDWLVEKGGIAGERMFVVAPKLDADGVKAGEKASRVDLSLK